MALQPLELKAALNLAALVLEFEAENSQADEWRAEVRRAKLTIDQALKREPPGEFFLSAEEKPNKKLNKSKDNRKMSHIILHDRKQNKDYKLGVSADVSRAEFHAGLDTILAELNALVARHGPALGAKREIKGINAVLKELERMTAKDKAKAKEAQPSGPIFADNRAGLAELLHKGSDFNATLAAAAAQTKAKNYNGDNKR